MEKIEKIEWDEQLSVDIPEIDDLQKKMFALLNVLIDLKDDQANAKDSSINVAELTEYGKYYFSKEEEYLRKAGYPETDDHAREHRKFIKTTVSLRRQVAEDKANLSYGVIKDLRDWLIVHISTQDHKYVPFLRTFAYVNECRAR
ncbi:hemerythrin [Desulfocicer vacuolatum DSM 3385]|uniref:Hemerythrin n=1 Tax=Desulfocicer vacuolatum DSM 3385 TaxID=1121400 RepID=A0A1W2BA71_9BACT|nr:bacteriohemerythrin [Desulfocicer vacuolatum]SMC69612.1 hemerythrin [Desulfocicer vacuolatum DSM 3385]